MFETARFEPEALYYRNGWLPHRIRYADITAVRTADRATVVETEDDLAIVMARLTDADRARLRELARTLRTQPEPRDDLDTSEPYDEVLDLLFEVDPDEIGAVGPEWYDDDANDLAEILRERDVTAEELDEDFGWTDELLLNRINALRV